MGTRRLEATLKFDVKGEGELKGFTSDLKEAGKAGKQAGPGIDSAAKGTRGLSGAVGSLLAGGALLAAGKQLIDFGKASIAAASDVQEMQSKFDTVFKDLSGPVTAELQAFADAANRSVYDLQGFAATLQDTFVPLGFARDEAAKTSVEVVKLAEDLASFNNLNTEDVVRDLQSALVGNTETLRKYGVVANQAAIDQEALALGFEFTKGQMDAQTKAAAVLSLTLKGTTDAQGDAVKTADSYANVTKGLEAAMTDLKVTIGQELLPVMTGLAKATTEVVKGTTSDVSAVRQLKNAYSDGKITLSEYLLGLDLLIVKGAEGEAVLTSLGISQAQLAAETGEATVRINQQALALELTAQLQEQSAQKMRDLSNAANEARISSGEFSDKQLQVAAAQANYNEKLEAGIVVSQGLGSAMAEAAAPGEEMIGVLDRINSRLADLGTQRDFTLNLSVRGLQGLEEAIRKASGFNAGDAFQDIPVGPRPVSNITEQGIQDIERGIAPDPIQQNLNSQGVKY